MNENLNISNVKDFIGVVVRYKSNSNYIEDVVISADLPDEHVIKLNCEKGELLLRNIAVETAPTQKIRVLQKKKI